jgi:superfamily I DNA and RNA helicase
LKPVNKQIAQQMKTLSEEVAAANHSTQETFDEIASDAAVLRATVTSMKDEISKQVKTSEKTLQVKIDKFDAEQRNAATALQNALG